MGSMAPASMPILTKQSESVTETGEVKVFICPSCHDLPLPANRKSLRLIDFFDARTHNWLWRDWAHMMVNRLSLLRRGREFRVAGQKHTLSRRWGEHPMARSHCRPYSPDMSLSNHRVVIGIVRRRAAALSIQKRGKPVRKSPAVAAIGRAEAASWAPCKSLNSRS